MGAEGLSGSGWFIGVYTVRGRGRRRESEEPWAPSGPARNLCSTPRVETRLTTFVRVRSRPSVVIEISPAL